MNTKRILSWGGFILIIGLIIWGMIAASQKANKLSSGIANVDQVTETDWVKGATSTNITLVEYSDFQCPACGAYYPLVEKVFGEYSSKILFVYRHFPLTQHPNAIPAAKASEAAGAQGKFWEMHAMLFTTQSDWENSTSSKAIFTGYAKKIGLDMEKFDSDYESATTSAKIDADLKSGLKAGVNSTPSFFLNGKKIAPQTYDQFKTLLDQAASSTKAA